MRRLAPAVLALALTAPALAADPETNKKIVIDF